MIVFRGATVFISFRFLNHGSDDWRPTHFLHTVVFLFSCQFILMKICCLVFLPSTVSWSTFGNAFLASYSADNVVLHSPDHVDIKVVEYLVLGIQPALSPRQSRCDDVNTYVIDEIDYI